MSHVCEQGVYYGFAQVDAVDPEDGAVHPMVMSLGWNPFYKNERLTAVRAVATLDVRPFADPKACSGNPPYAPI